MAILRLGRAPGDLELGYVTNDPWSDGLIYKVGGVATAWPAAPVLEFTSPDVPDITAVLSDSNTRADWSLTEAQVNALDASQDKRVRISVQGATWFAGFAVRDA